MKLLNKVKQKFVGNIVRIIGRSVNLENRKSISRALKLLYLLRSGRHLNIIHPKSYTEKIQAYKLRMDDLDYEKYVDKLAVRELITNKLSDDKLIPLLGVWDCPDLIDYSKLPDSFVLKTNHGAGMNIIVHNKSVVDKRKFARIIKKWLSVNYTRVNGFEMQYKDIIPKIYAESLIKDKNDNLTEYKFLCFNGIPYFCIIDNDRFGEHKRNIYDLEWNLQMWNIGLYEHTNTPLVKPSNFEELVDTAKILCKDFSHVRVDLYDVDGHIYFSELTFTTGSGYSFPNPHSANIMLGRLWDLK